MHLQILLSILFLSCHGMDFSVENIPTQPGDLIIYPIEEANNKEGEVHASFNNSVLAGLVAGAIGFQNKTQPQKTKPEEHKDQAPSKQDNNTSDQNTSDSTKVDKKEREDFKICNSSQNELPLIELDKEQSKNTKK